MTASEGTTGTFTLDRDLVVVSWDDWMADATGKPAAEARGTFIGDLYPELADRGMIARLQRIVDGGGVEVLATAFHQYLLPVPPRSPRSSFDRMRQFVTLAPRSDGGRTIGVIVTIEDVTDRFEQDQAEAADATNPDENVRLRAVRRLGERSDPSLVAGSLADESWRVRREAADAIARSTDEHAVTTLIAAIRERHQDPATLNASLTALANSAADVVGPVAALLDDDDHDVRVYAALALGLLGDSRAVPKLVERLTDPDDNVRFHVLEALGRIGDRSAADAVAAVAETRDFAVAFAALDALAAIGEPSVAHRLLPLLDDDLLAEPAANCIGLLGSEEVVGPLVRMLGREGKPIATLAVALERIQERLDEYFGDGALVADLARASAPPEAVDRLRDRLDGASDEELHALVTVLGWLRGPNIDSSLTPLLAHPSVGPHVADVLGRRGVDAAPEIMAAGRDLSGEARRLAAVALRRIGWDVTTPLLISWLTDEPPVIVAAAGALGAIGDSRAFYPLLRGLAHPMATVRQAIVSALNSLGHPDMPSVIATRLSDPSPEVREAAARIAGYFGYARCLDRMVALSTDPVESVRRVAVEALASYDAPTAWLAIANAAVGDKSPAVRAAAVRACRDPRSREVEKVVADSLSDTNLWVRYQGLYAVASRALQTRIMPSWLPARVVDRARADAAPPVRIAAIEVIGQLRIDRGLPTLIAAIADPEPDIAAAAALALGEFDVPESVSTLQAVVSSHNEQMQRAAIDSLGRLRAGAAVASIADIAWDSDNDLTGRTAIAALARIGTPESARALIALLASRDRRAEASRALSRASGDMLSALIEALQDPDASIRCSVIEILARARRADTARAVSAALSDDAAGVRSAAEQALTRRDLRDVEEAMSAAAKNDANPTVRAAAATAMDRE